MVRTEFSLFQSDPEMPTMGDPALGADMTPPLTLGYSTLDHGLEFQLLCFQPSSLIMCFERQQVMAQVLGVLLPKWETRMKFLPPGFFVVQPWPLQSPGE